LERNTGFEPAAFALATSTFGVHEGSRPITKQHDPLISLGSSSRTNLRGSTDLHADSRRSCAQYVPGSARETAAPPLDVAQVAALLGCSTARVYHLCERGELPHGRDRHNAIRFECSAIGTIFRLKGWRSP
jgi:predicted DNA-binding transcriptional regulator AlpA